MPEKRHSAPLRLCARIPSPTADVTKRVPPPDAESLFIIIATCDSRLILVHLLEKIAIS